MTEDEKNEHRLRLHKWMGGEEEEDITVMDKLIDFLDSACLHFNLDTWVEDGNDKTEISIERDNYKYSGAGHFINFIFDQDEDLVEINVR